AAATGQASPRAALVRLRAALTPALAAEREGVALDVEALATAVRRAGDGAEFVIVEGAGGLLSPLSWESDITTLAHRLDGDATRVLVVGSDRLGVINHAPLTVQVLLDTWLMPLGVVLSAPAVADASTGTNAAALRRRLAAYAGVHDRIATCPRVASADDAATA